MGISDERRRKMRGEIAERGLLLRRVAAAADLHPTRLWMMLRGTLRMPEQVADRVTQALSKMESPVA